MMPMTLRLIRAENDSQPKMSAGRVIRSFDVPTRLQWSRLKASGRYARGFARNGGWFHLRRRWAARAL